MQEIKHSNVMGGSTAAQRRNCPGSYQLEKDLPEAPASEFANRGLMLHAAMEMLITADPSSIKEAEPLFEELIGQDMGYKGEEITQELVDTKLRPALNAWFEIVDQYGIDDWFIEQRVSLEELIPNAFGTADIIAKDKNNRIHGLDWKFGDGIVVDVIANDGCAFYTAAALYDPEPELKEFLAHFDATMFFHIVQPRVNVEQVYSSWETDIDWLEAWIDQSIEAYDKSQLDDPPLKVGKWCQFCKAKGVNCKAYEALAGEALSKNPVSSDAVTIAENLRMADLLKPWIDSVFENAQKELEGGAAIPGWKLVEKRAQRKWRDAVAAEERLRAARLKQTLLYKRTLVSPTQLEKIKPRLYNKIVDEYVVKQASGVTIVPDTDKRLAVTGTMQLLNNALPDQKS